MTRDEAVAILHQHVKNENLRRHMYATEAAMRAYAAKYHGDPDEWGMVGLLHDFDWEIHPNLHDHPRKGQFILESRGVPEPIRRAILAHAPLTDVKPESMMEKCIFAVDEMAGFIVACALVQPDKQLAQVTVEGIKKKLKSKGFAAKVNRGEIAAGVAILGIPEDEHYQNVLAAMQGIHEALGL
ncbi:MAG: HAD family hydrolase [Candidatus Kerfeldbacteria bacterium]|nr:HAD family hydrolase [Candidatus Kerfeldbacteria bacterium]